MPQLKPCPFCGGEAHAERSPVVGICAVVCNCASHVFYDAEADMDKTIDAWNTRAERTCEFKPFKDEDWSEPNAMRGVCSECSALMYGKDRFCPNCGAKVTEEDTDGRQRD